MNRVNHYKWLEKHLPAFFAKVGINWSHNAGIIGAHGDKCYCYRSNWQEANIPFPHGVAIYLMTYCRPYAESVRQTANGWVAAEDWVIENYARFKQFLPEVDYAVVEFKRLSRI